MGRGNSGATDNRGLPDHAGGGLGGRRGARQGAAFGESPSARGNRTCPGRGGAGGPGYPGGGSIEHGWLCLRPRPRLRGPPAVAHRGGGAGRRAARGAPATGRVRTDFYRGVASGGSRHRRDAGGYRGRRGLGHALRRAGQGRLCIAPGNGCAGRRSAGCRGNGDFTAARGVVRDGGLRAGFRHPQADGGHLDEGRGTAGYRQPRGTTPNPRLQRRHGMGPAPRGGIRGGRRPADRRRRGANGRRRRGVAEVGRRFGDDRRHVGGPI